MVIKTRLLRLIIRRLLSLPKGVDFFRYSFNRISHFHHKRTRNPIVRRPVSLMLELTNHCQLKCFICAREYEYGKAMDKGHMDLESLKKLIGENHVYLDRIGLTGLGETLLYPHIVEAVDFIRAKNNGISIFISTNAYQKDAPALVDRLADKIDTLQVSLDGIGAMFEGIRGRSQYDIYYDNLQQIVAVAPGRRMRVKFNMVVFEKNFKQMKDVIRVAHALDVREVFINTFNLVATDLPMSMYEFYRSEEFLREFHEALKTGEELGVYIGHHDVTGLRGFQYCGYPWDDFYITWDGYAVPCCAKPFPKELNFGNVFREGLEETLNSPAYQKFRKAAKGNVTLDFCKRCHKIN